MALPGGYAQEPARTTAYLRSLQSTEEKGLFDVVDKLRELDVNRELSLPQLVVCGSQSSSKSSVLEAISEIPFPRFVAVYQEAKKKLSLSNNQGFARDALRVQITGRAYQPLTFMDLPRLIESHTGNQDNHPGRCGSKQRPSKASYFDESNPNLNWHVINKRYWGIDQLRNRLRTLLYEQTKRQLPKDRKDVAVKDRFQSPDQLWTKYNKECKELAVTAKIGVDKRFGGVVHRYRDGHDRRLLGDENTESYSFMEPLNSRRILLALKIVAVSRLGDYVLYISTSVLFVR
ncbi:hypothetical protein Egran_04651 [Elaphomyces granulatus]|uniref:Dynamin GTPase domain-containing protein n=1 Tax=Elaphomyces granulatus TaxID=519963 RepID=A0A232LTX5_9EURO|nr:hypothetical protein Egran_04651 [Elaphomyces granulatus]